jgi:thiamine-monophosphate kinase
MPRNPTQISAEGKLLRRIERAAWSESRTHDKSGLRLGIGDDAALWKPRPGLETILTTDWFLEGTHFLRKLHPPDSVGWKCLARALSDVAAMGGEPRCFLLSLALPENAEGEWLNQFLAGLRRASRKLSCSLAGGDTTRRNKILINISVAGEVKAGRAVTRSGAKRDDRIFVSGRLGEAELGLKLLRKNGSSRTSHTLLQKHLYPEPRIELGKWLASNDLATAMMDLSDGLSLDLARLCVASCVGANIYSGSLPVASKTLSSKFDAATIKQAGLHGGDDYELLFCVPDRLRARIPRNLFGLRLTEIGQITRRAGIKLVEPSGKATLFGPNGWDPFRK